MAKRSGGLGRGLSSLLGGSFEESNNYPSTRVEKEEAIQEEAASAANVSLREPERVFVGTDGTATIETPRENVEETLKRAQVLEDKEKGTLPLDKISPNPDQPRTSFDQEKLKELAASIARDGLLQAILVRPMEDGSYQIIAGERRWHASKMAGLEEVPVRIVDSSDEKVLELAMVENLQRSDLNPIEEAYGYRRMIERQGMTQQEVAEAVSKGRSTIANALRLLDLPEEAQQALFEEQITAGHARAILAVPSVEEQKKLTQKIVSERLSVREAENLARLAAGRTSTNTPARTPLPASYKKVAKALRKSLGTNVKVKTAGGKNKIEIEFKDEEDLKRLYEYISTK